MLNLENSIENDWLDNFCTDTSGWKIQNIGLFLAVIVNEDNKKYTELWAWGNSMLCKMQRGSTCLWHQITKASWLCQILVMWLWRSCLVFLCSTFGNWEIRLTLVSLLSIIIQIKQVHITHWVQLQCLSYSKLPWSGEEI